MRRRAPSYSANYDNGLVSFLVLSYSFIRSYEKVLQIGVFVRNRGRVSDFFVLLRAEHHQSF